jgi:hypothetical protein
VTGAPLRTVLIGLAVAALWAVATPSEACTCLENGPACEAYWKASTVFIGRVTAVSPPQTRKPGAAFLRSRRVTLEVSEAFSGVAGSTVEVTTGSGGGDCGFPFKEGLDYVVYATRPDPDAPLVVSVCSRTRVLAEASSDLAYARAVASGVPLTGTISGRVSLATRSLTPGVGKTTRPFAGAGVVLDLGGTTTRVVTGSDGVFAATGLAAGRYTARLDLPDGFAGEVWPKTIDLVDARGCAEVQAEAFADGRVGGQVVDAAARPIAGLTVELTVPAGLDAALGPERLRALTDAAGRYEIRRVPAGRFVIGINTQRDGQGQLIEPRLFLPGVASLASATRVRVAEGERVTVENFVVPGAFRFVSLTGVVFDASGTPAANARVYLKGPAESDYVLGEPVVTGPDGRFTLAAVAGRSYRVFAERPRDESPGGRIDSSEQATVAAGPEIPPIKLVLRRPY